MEVYLMTEGPRAGRLLIRAEVDPFFYVCATPLIEQEYGYGSATARTAKPVKIEDYVYLYPHLPKNVKKELGILK